MDRYNPPSAIELNKLLSKCKLQTHPVDKLGLALARSVCHLSIFEEKSTKLYGFVRATSDHGLNANLWDLAVLPGNYQDHLIAILVDHALKILRREMPGCSISISAPLIALEALQEQGFLVDPNGIRAMGIRLR